MFNQQVATPASGQPAANPPKAAPQPYFAAVDGLRAVACLAVVSFHCFFYGGQVLWLHFSLGRWDLAPAGFLSYGYLSVELFFVLSGFCLAYPLLRHPERPHDWKRYFYNRVRRIYPAYWGALLFLGALAVLIVRAYVPALSESHVLVLPPLRRLCLFFQSVVLAGCVAVGWLFYRVAEKPSPGAPGDGPTLKRFRPGLARKARYSWKNKHQKSPS